MSYYDDSLLLMMNFNRITALGENNNYVVDHSIYGYDGVVNDSPFFTLGKNDLAINYSGNPDEFIEIVDGPSPTSGITIAAWVKPNRTDRRSPVVYKGSVDVPHRGYKFYAANYGGFNAVFTVDDQTISAGAKPPVGEWTHMVGTYDKNGQIRIYFNGFIMNSAAATQGDIEYLTYSGYNNTYIAGMLPSRQDTFDGLIDDVFIFNRSFSATEVEKLYLSSLTKYTANDWILTINQTKSLSQGLDPRVYLFRGYAIDSAGSTINTGQRKIRVCGSNLIQVVPSVGDLIFSCDIPMNDPEVDAFPFANYFFPYGLVEFVVDNVPVGGPVTVNITWPGNVTNTSQYWKFGPRPLIPDNYWYMFPFNDNDWDPELFLTITDGAIGDDDLTADGIIFDQGGPAVATAYVSVMSSSLSYLLLACMMGLLLFGYKKYRK